MTQPAAAPATLEHPVVPSDPAPRLRGRWMLLVRGVWLVLAAGMLANFVASIPAYYQLMSTVCPLSSQGDCSDTSGQLAADTIQALTSLHLSLNSYALSFVTLDVVLSLLPWGIGLLLFWRKSDEGMGLFVSLLLILFAGNGISNTLSGLWAGAHPSPLITLVLNGMSGVQWIGLGAFLLTFPTGRFAPRWSAFMLAFWVLTFLSPPLPSLLSDVVDLLAALLTLGGTLFVLVYRYWRVFDAPQRQQTKWVVYAAAWAVTALLGNALPLLLPAQSPFQLLFPTVIILLPSVFLYLGLSFGILRYRLWDIDTLINKTLVYGSLTALLGTLYAGLIIGLEGLSGLFGGTAAQNPVVLVVSTLAIAALVQPVRRRIQTLIDRRFYRKKYDAEKTLAAFSAQLRNEVDLEHLRERLVAVVQETMQPTHVSLWLRQPTRLSTEQAHRLEPLVEGPRRPNLD